MRFNHKKKYIYIGRYLGPDYKIEMLYSPVFMRLFCEILNNIIILFANMLEGNYSFQLKYEKVCDKTYL